MALVAIKKKIFENSLFVDFKNRFNNRYKRQLNNEEILTILSGTVTLNDASLSSNPFCSLVNEVRELDDLLLPNDAEVRILYHQVRAYMMFELNRERFGKKSQRKRRWSLAQN